MAGSTFKPFAARRRRSTDGYSLKDTFDGNSPYEFPDGTDGEQRGTRPRRLGNDYGTRSA